MSYARMPCTTVYSHKHTDAFTTAVNNYKNKTTISLSTMMTMMMKKKWDTEKDDAMRVRK